MKYNYLLLLALAFAASVQATTRKVLFIGNSYIYSNDIPAMLKQLALSKGDTLVYDQHCPGGQTFQQHSVDATTISKIKSQKWDIVILQEQSQRPAFNPGQVAMQVYPYARTLDSLIKDNNTCTETMFYMTWGRKNGDAANCGFYPPICTYEGMQARLRESYLEMTDKNDAVIAPVGAAWKVVRDSVPAIDLYVSDESHPSIHGSYLAACVFYASIFHNSPKGATYTANLPTADAQKLQHFSAKVAIDSMAQWQQHGNYTTAAFTRTVANKTITLQNKSTFATNYKWTFGDGNSSTQAAPTHTYAQNGKYAVTLTASNNCFTESRTDTVTIGPVNVESVEKTEQLRVAYMSDGSVKLHVSTTGISSVDVYNTLGVKVKSYAVYNGAVAINDLVPGMYFCRPVGAMGSIAFTIR